MWSRLVAAVVMVVALVVLASLVVTHAQGA
jgi:hypothetical protein